MILEEGKTYTNEELAEWFQVKPATFTKAKKKKLEYLKYFAEFEEIKCKVKITKVYEPNYINPRDKESNNKLYQHGIENVIKETPLQLYKTCTGRVIQQENEIKRLNHSFETSYKYVRENLPKIAITERRVWCRRYYGEAVDFIPLTPGQLATWKKLISIYISEDGEGRAEVMAEYQSLGDNGELTQDEVKEHIYQLHKECWERAKDQFYAQYKFVPNSVPQWKLTAWEGYK